MEKKNNNFIKLNSSQKNLSEFLDNESNPEDFEKIDWTFKTANTTELTHLIFNDYPARMIPQIARKLIKLYYPKYKDPIKKKPILDPFAGSGTTCVESIIRNIDSIAFDLNPLAQLITSVRTTLISYQDLRKYLSQYKKLIETNQNIIHKKYIPDDPNLSYWYNEKVLLELSKISSVINLLFPKKEIDGDENLRKIKDIFLLCLAKVGRDCSYQRSGEHKSYRIPKNKIPEFDKKVDPINYFYKLFKNYSRVLGNLYDFYNSQNNTAVCETYLGNSMNLEGICENSIDLIVTSPPYGDSHTTVAYGQFSRFPLEWIQFEYDEIKNIDKDLLGGVTDQFEFIESQLLLSISKDILSEEVKQQNQILNNVYKKLNDDTFKFSNSELLDDIKLKFKKLYKFEQEIEDIDNIKELSQLKDHYSNSIKEVRRVSMNFKNKFKSEYHDLSYLKFKIYDERLPYVIAFFSDLYKVLKRLYYVLDYERNCCIVIGNRTVKRVKVPTDDIIVELGRIIGFSHVTSYYREIPNKRMPRKNSPTNIKGEILSTMNEETIIVLKKQKI